MDTSSLRHHSDARLPQTEREARMALASFVPRTERPAVAAQVWQDGALATYEMVFKGSTDDPLTRRARRVDLDLLEALCEQAGATFIVPGDDEWPERLGDLRATHEQDADSRDPQPLAGNQIPFGLWRTGEALALTRPVALVGSRAATAYGQHVAEQMGYQLTERGSTVVASTAYGVEIAALRGAMAGHRQAPATRPHPVVVLATGHLAPVRLQGHEQVVEELKVDGTILSEHPPYQPLTRAGCLDRSRVLAALADVTVLIEGSTRSNARVAMDAAYWMRRLCGGVPGPVTSVNSAAPHELVQRGRAQLVTDAADVLDMLDALAIGDHQFEEER